MAYICLMLGGAGLTAIYYFVYAKHKGIHILIMMAGALLFSVVLYCTAHHFILQL